MNHDRTSIDTRRLEGGLMNYDTNINLLHLIIGFIVINILGLFGWVAILSIILNKWR